MKTAAFTVRGSQEQAIRWKRAADAEGYASAGAWLAVAADCHLKARARAGHPLPLAWQRRCRFRVILMDGSEVEVRGVTSAPFGVFQGNASGPNGNLYRTLVHLPTRRVIATLRTSAQCRTLAAEIAPSLLRGELPDSAPIVERHVRESL
jgi:hypothetical protein